MSKPSIVDVTITAPSADWLAEHTRNLIEQHLLASGNIVPNVRSIYRWQGSIKDEAEAYANLHTRAEHVDEIIQLTNEAHPCDTVHVLAIDIVNADDRYHRWILDQTNGA